MEIAPGIHDVITERESHFAKLEGEGRVLAKGEWFTCLAPR